MLIDLLFLSIISVMVFVCFKKGFAVSLFNALSALISIILVFALKNPISEFLKNSFYGKYLYNKLFEIIQIKYIADADSFIDNNIPEIFSGILKSETIKVNDIASFIADKIFELGILIVTFLLLIIIVKAVTKFFPKIIRIFTRIPVIKQFDKLLGMIFGIVYGTIWASVAVYIIKFISVYFDSEFLTGQVSVSYVTDFLNNLI